MSLSTPLIHPTAVVSSEARIAEGVSIGPCTVIDGPVSIARGCSIGPHVHLIGPLEIGERNTFDAGAVIGGAPQHIGYRGESTRVVIGDRNTFREHVTVHRGMPVGAGPGTGMTRIGDGNLFMAGSHVGHDCTVGNDGLYANGALLGGHVETGDRVFLSGNSAVHQFCRVGRLALLSGTSASSKDIPPFWVIQRINRVCGVNVIGMRRAGIPAEQIQAVRGAFQLLYVEGLTIPLALGRIEAQWGSLPAIRELIDFIRTSKRGISGPGSFLRESDNVAA
jgi:UDP-N-acetylglucosamine acyltransferase